MVCLLGKIYFITGYQKQEKIRMSASRNKGYQWPGDTDKFWVWFGILWPTVKPFRSCHAGQITYILFSWAGIVFCAANHLSTHFSQLLKSALLESAAGENDHRNHFMIYLQENYVAELGFELETPGSAVRWATNCAMNTRPWGYKTFFMLNSAEHEIFQTNKSQITNNCKFFLAKHCWAWNFLC